MQVEEGVGVQEMLMMVVEKKEEKESWTEGQAWVQKLNEEVYVYRLSNQQVENTQKRQRKSKDRHTS